MARYFFPAEVVLLPPDDAGIARAAVNAGFSCWDDQVSGNAYTDLVAPDGVSPLDPVVDGQGQRPPLRGPEGVKWMWCDCGSGYRFPMYSSEALTWLLDNYEGPVEPTGDIDGGTF